jgi:CheY-like chemotaxis protein
LISEAFKILLVDDDDLSQRMMGLLMSEKGYGFDIASNGIEAMEAVKSKAYDLVLMDLQMPVMDGFEATRKIRDWESGKRHTPIVALTAMLFPDEVEKCLDSGMDDCISKPFNTEVLFRLIESYADAAPKTATSTIKQSAETINESSMLDIREALPRFGRDVEIYREFLKEFIESLPLRIGQFRVNYLSGDFKALSDSAHNLKGISASMGAKQLSFLSQKLDRDSQDGNLPVAEQSLKEVEAYVAKFQSEAMDILSGFTEKQEINTSSYSE